MGCIRPKIHRTNPLISPLTALPFTTWWQLQLGAVCRVWRQLCNLNWNIIIYWPVWQMSMCSASFPEEQQAATGRHSPKPCSQGGWHTEWPCVANPDHPRLCPQGTGEERFTVKLKGFIMLTCAGVGPEGWPWQQPAPAQVCVVSAWWTRAVCGNLGQCLGAGVPHQGSVWRLWGQKETLELGAAQPGLAMLPVEQAPCEVGRQRTCRCLQSPFDQHSEVFFFLIFFCLSCQACWPLLWSLF